MVLADGDGNHWQWGGPTHSIRGGLTVNVIFSFAGAVPGIVRKVQPRLQVQAKWKPSASPTLHLLHRSAVHLPHITYSSTSLSIIFYEHKWKNNLPQAHVVMKCAGRVQDGSNTTGRDVRSQKQLTWQISNVQVQSVPMPAHLCHIKLISYLSPPKLHPFSITRGVHNQFHQWVSKMEDKHNGPQPGPA